MTHTPLPEPEWLRLMLRTYKRSEYPEACCPWETAMRNRLNDIANPDGPLFKLHGEEE